MDEQFEDCVRRFERAWQTGPPNIADYLPAAESADRPRRAALLAELIAVDLEFRWRATRGAREADLGVPPPEFPPRVEDFAARWPELLSQEGLPLDLIAEEYRARRRGGDRPSAAEYAARFPDRAELPSALRRVDDELAREWAPRPPRSTPGPKGADRSALPAAPEPPFDPRAPLSHRDYVLRAFLGAGGMGKVYRAAQRSLDKIVAVKVLRKAYRDQEEVVERFLDEARLVARLRHPGIVDVHGVGRMWNGAPFIVMDYLSGGDLARAASAGRVSASQAADWVRHAAEAIQHAHDRGVVHCDLKPGNLLLDESGRARVTDFGLARALAARQRVRVLLAGTAVFMAPEQADPHGAIDARTDVYGLGGVLYALLAGYPPLHGARSADVLADLLRGRRPTPLHEIRPDVPRTLADIVERCLRPDPAARYPTAAAVATALRGASNEHSPP